MRTFTVGLVAEGKNDFEVIKPVVKRVILEKDPKATVDFVDLQPSLDATSGRYLEGGWAKVYAWCLKSTSNRRNVDIFSGGMFGTSKRCDVLVVHLDADCLEEFARKAPAVELPARPYSALSRAAFVENVLGEWLWPDGTQPRDPNAEKCFPLAAVQATETWLVSASIPGIVDPEEQDPVPLMILIDGSLEDPAKPNTLLKWGVTEKYATLAADLALRMVKSRKLCPQLDKFCLYLERRLTPIPDAQAVPS